MRASIGSPKLSFTLARRSRRDLRRQMRSGPSKATGTIGKFNSVARIAAPLLNSWSPAVKRVRGPQPGCPAGVARAGPPDKYSESCRRGGQPRPRASRVTVVHPDRLVRH